MYTIAHLDADCFYVSAERVRHPYLRGQPVGVLGNWGACVIAKSYELKAAKVMTGQPIWEAVKLCPNAIFIKRDFRWYQVLSSQILEIVREYSPRVEYYSIDEMFFDADGINPREIQQRILKSVGVPVSIGISSTKSLAKLASDCCKPFGCHTLIGDDIEPFLKTKCAEEITGIGYRSATKLVHEGIRTCWDFAQADRRLIRKLLTKRGEVFWWEINGTQSQPILANRPPHKCISRGGSMGESTNDPNRLIAWLVRNVERLIEELDYYQVHTGRVTLWLEYKGGGGCSQSLNLPEATATFSILLDAVKKMLVVGPLIEAMHILAEKLTYRNAMQHVLFPQAVDRAAVVKREINQKIGRFALRSGETLYLGEIYHDEAQDFDICDVHGKMCF